MIGPKIAAPNRADERDAYELVTLRDNDTCQRCRRDCGWGITSRHHRKNRSVGGRTEVVNLTVLGGTGTTGCHGFVTQNPAAALEEGWTVPGWADPATYPGRRWVPTVRNTLILAWVTYDNAGNFNEISDDEAARRMRGESE